MEEPQNNPEPQPEGGREAPAKGPAKVIRAGGEAKAPAASAAVPILRAGRHAVEGAEAAGRTVLEGADEAGQRVVEGADAAGQRVVDGVEAAVRAAEEADGGAGGQVLREWVHCAQRAYVRNVRALSELLYCRTPYGFLQWQNNLLRETTADLSATNARIVQLVSQKA